MQRLQIVMVVFCGLLATTCAWAQNDTLDSNPAVVSFEKMPYPPLPKTARIEGLVVIQAKLDDSGHVIDATALSGHKMLVGDALANIKKWRFAPNGESTAIVVYDFRINDPCDHPVSFVLKGNHAIISGAAMLLE